jgi:sugar/nucleoside kinase (ribokinase family)
MALDIIGFGACSVDDFLCVGSYPLRGGKTRVKRRYRAGGGLAATALVAAARLGASAAWCGTLGDDPESGYALAELAREGVDTSFVCHRSGARPHTSVILVEETGERTILAASDGIMSFPPDAVTPELIASCRVAFVDHHFADTALRAAQLAHELRVPVVGDIERTDAPGLGDLLPLIDHLIVGIEAGRRLSGAAYPTEILHRLTDQGAPARACVAVTDGARGCWFVAEGGEVCHQPAFAVEAVDTTGCGDVFHGAYMAGLVGGKGVAPSIRLAAAVAALKATGAGGRAAIPSREQAEAFMKQA